MKATIIGFTTAVNLHLVTHIHRIGKTVMTVLNGFIIIVVSWGELWFPSRQWALD
jgi:hypothetical protein